MELGKTLLLGDSYTTFEGYIPNGYLSFYIKAGREITDVTRVEETWWYGFQKECGMELVLNSSYSGSTVCHTGYNKEDFSKISFVGRVDELSKNGFFDKNKLDSILICGGTNDCWANVPIGYPVYGEWNKEQLYSFAPAINYLLSRITDLAPNARVYFVLNDELSEDIVSNIVLACTHYRVNLIKLAGIEKVSGHPTITGMQSIHQQVKEGILSVICNMQTLPEATD